jgi:Zn-dependent peptidase ImmA (M78 family)
MYSVKQAAKELNISESAVRFRSNILGIKKGVYGKKFTKSEFKKIRNIGTPVVQIHTNNIIEVIKVTQTFHIYESRMNYPD